MCAIAGIFNLDGTEVERKVLHRMDTVMIHRGPDGHGEHIERNIGLANRRLAIIDPSSAGKQPMSTIDGNLWITFNGEIYNYIELRNDLSEKGYKFKSHTDTETILYGYRHYGSGYVKKLIGQFAFCIWDRLRDELILARDHVGINPLYYSLTGKNFVFASEVKSILSSGYVKKEIDPESIHHFLSMFCIPAPLTIFQGIKCLLPGHILKVNFRGLEIRKYWELPVGLWRENRKSVEEIREGLKNLLFSAVSYASVSDVPVGAFLSGGIDSSTIVALLSIINKKPVRTFSLWSKGGEAYDERKFALAVSKKYKTIHTELTVSPQDIVREFPKFIYSTDQPTGGSIETYFISKETTKYVKVALSGLGGDELFAGYHRELYATKKIGDIYHHLPPSLRALVFHLLKNIPLGSDWKKTITVSEKFFNLPTIAKRSLFLYFAYQEEEKNRLYSKSFVSSTKKYNTSEYFSKFYKEVEGQHPVDQLNYIDLKSYTRDDLLMGMNMMSMAHSLETRVPFLDPRLISFSASIPPNLKYKNGISKFILKNIAREWLPEEVINHQKTGFAVPRVIYMKGPLKSYILSVLDKKSIKKRGLFNEGYIQESLNKFYEDKSKKRLWSEHLRIWLLYILELWCRIYLDRNTVEIPNCTLSDLSA